MTENTNKSNKRACEWCGESISLQALKCPICKKWRKDIYQDRIKSFFWGVLCGISMGIFINGLRYQWWHQKIKTLPQEKNDLFTSLVKLTGGGYSYEFSFVTFLTSVSGFVIFVGFLITSILTFKYYARVSKKIGIWWWF